jgi:aspartate aminotransferase
MSTRKREREQQVPPPAGTAPAKRLDSVELSLIRQINALATPLSINLGIGEPNLEPDERLREMASRASTTSWRYSPNAGSIALRRKLCEATGFDPRSEVCVTAGTQEALFAVFTAYVDPGDEVLIPNPGFVSYATLARMSGAVPVTYDLEPPGWEVDLADLTKKITNRTKLIVVNSPSNPLGAVLPKEVLEAIASTGILVVSDEVYREIWYDEAPASMLNRGDNVVVLNGLSKSHGMTGLRIGWIHARADVMKPIVTAHQYIATCASVFSQTLAEQILGDVQWNEGWLASVRTQFRIQREAALHAIEHELGIGIAPPAGAFYAFIPVPACESSSFAHTLATDAAVLTIPGVAFGTRGQGFIRLSFAAPPGEISAGIERIGRWLEQNGR